MSREDVKMEMQEMQNEKAAENKKADKKAFKQFILCAVVGTVIGFFAGFFGINGKEGMMQMGEKLMNVLNWVTPFANFVFSTVLWIVAASWMRQARRLFVSWDGEEETLIGKVERKLSYGLTLLAVNMILIFFFFGLGYAAVDFKEDRNLAVMRAVATLAGLIYAMTINIIYQKKFVNLIKEINPEKQGSVYEIKFQKIWMASCDESELLTIYKAGYAAYQTTSYVCMALLVVCVLGITLWDAGIMPMTLVTIIWLTLTIRYEVEGIRLSKHS